jgi:ATP-dependent DNA ligase
MLACCQLDIAYFHRYEKNGAEGLIIRKPNSYYYEKGGFLKVENYYDADALVTAHKDGQLICKLYDL